MTDFPLSPAHPSVNAGTPYAPEYGDVYHTASGGLEQARQVFMAATGLPERWRERDTFTVLETGFGLGLNFLATWQAWRSSPSRGRRLHYVSVEKHPLVVSDLSRLLAAYPELTVVSGELVAAWPLLVPGCQRLHFEDGSVTLTLLFGDVGELDQLAVKADAIFLDGFSPARNPVMWSPRVMRMLARKAGPDARLATWSVAGEVRRGLESAGFVVEKRPGFGGKREMLAARFPSGCAMRRPNIGSIAIIGAGLAGTGMTQRLAERGMRVTLFDTHPWIAHEASGNPVGVFRPLFSRDDNRAARFSRAAFCYAMHHWDRLAMFSHNPHWLSCGVVQIARDDAEAQRWSETLSVYPAQYIKALAANEIRQLAGIDAAQGGYHVPLGGWMSPPSLCAAQTASHAERVETHLNTTITRLEHSPPGWRLMRANHPDSMEFDAVILANASRAAELAPSLPLQPVRGQLSYLPQGSIPEVQQVIAREGYVTPAVNGMHVLGASYDFDDVSNEPSPTSHASNLQRLSGLLPGWEAKFSADTLTGRAAFRSTTADRLPVIGELQPGLYAFTGLGSRGIVWSALGAELLACLITGEPLPVEDDLVAAVSPERFFHRPHD
ncbi:MAG: bifunctional tRNA (5-methylaminomethyl-2-thiouridine)(34)-methyltransferase MnmD/FAD-dependent 5-carboxymethylaminomethyl-2-thiouridine(34) oxidoreductase MnmC [Thiobacillaceae bacterium]